jgi:hypothetical protein
VLGRTVFSRFDQIILATPHRFIAIRCNFRAYRFRFTLQSFPEEYYLSRRICQLGRDANPVPALELWRMKSLVAAFTDETCDIVCCLERRQTNNADPL